MTILRHAEARRRPHALLWRPRLVEKAARHVEKFIDVRRYGNWFAGKQLTTDWTSGNFSTWRRVLRPWRDRPLRILEIGSWEGRSALFFLNFFPRARLVCVDSFEEYPVNEERFDRNVAGFAGRIEKIKGQSVPALDRLVAERRQFDLVYLDGDHGYDAVMADSLRVWSLVEPGAAVIWDDYRWGRWLPPERRTKAAVDEFLQERSGQYRLLAENYQLIVERTR
jgi:Methyltransferase domain